MPDPVTISTRPQAEGDSRQPFQGVDTETTWRSAFRHLYAEASAGSRRPEKRFVRSHPSTIGGFTDHRNGEDATQEAFARAFERWGRLSGEPWVVGWIVTTTLNVVRRSARRTAEEFLDWGEDPSSGEDVDSVVDLWGAIRELPRR